MLVGLKAMLILVRLNKFVTLCISGLEKVNVDQILCYVWVLCCLHGYFLDYFVACVMYKAQWISNVGGC